MHTRFAIALALVALSGCGKSLNSDEKARLAYIGLDKSVQKSLTLGFAGFNAAGSANIPTQSGTGDAQGALTIAGQVDQGASNNKTMRLKIGMSAYSDGTVQIPGDDQAVRLTFATSTDTASQPDLTVQLKNMPNGTYEGTLVGAFAMSGDLEGNVALNLTFGGQIQDDGSGKVVRKAGTTTITGTAVSPDGTYQVNVGL